MKKARSRVYRLYLFLLYVYISVSDGWLYSGSSFFALNLSRAAWLASAFLLLSLYTCRIKLSRQTRV